MSSEHLTQNNRRRQRKQRSSREKAPVISIVDQINLVCIGSSAGGLEALLEFFSAVPKNFRMAFVLIQHMSPDFDTMLPQILERQTGHKITLANDGEPIAAGRAYLIPPKKIMTVFNGKLLLKNRDPSDPTSFYPIDTFFCSAAIEFETRLIGVLLSGTGSDGTKGAREIRSKSGCVIVQELESAIFSGMPKQAIDVHAFDSIAKPADMYKFIQVYTSQSEKPRPPLVGEAEKSDSPISSHFDKVLQSIRSKYDIDLTFYGDELVLRRMKRRAEICNVKSMDEYWISLLDDNLELDRLHSDLLIGVTEFNRHPETLEHLKNELLPGMLEQSSDTIRIWVVGCSTGEEAFTIAFMLNDFLTERGSSKDFKIFATDVNEKSIKLASRAYFSPPDIAHLPAKWRHSYFTYKNGLLSVRPGLRERIVFAKHNVIKDAPFPQLDFILCRNLFIYLKTAAKVKIAKFFQFSLNNDGYLLLGPSESVPSSISGFTKVDSDLPIYINQRKRHSFSDIDNSSRKRSFQSLGELRKINKNEEIKHRDQEIKNLIVKDHLDTGVLVFDNNFKALYYYGDIQSYLRPFMGKASHQLKDILPEDVYLQTMKTFEELKGKDLHKSSFTFNEDNTRKQLTLIEIAHLNLQMDGESLFILKLANKNFSDLGIDKSKVESTAETAIENAKLRNDLAATRKALADTRAEVSTTVGKLATSNEELITANEELQTNSEELQSTNEELQAVNEELYTVNAECQQRITELSEISTDIQNIYDVSEIGTIFIDKDYRIRKFNKYCQKIFKLIPDDIGRPLEHFSTALEIDFKEKVQVVVNTGKFFQKTVKTKDDSLFLLRVAPYKTQENETKGVVLVLLDISSLTTA